MFTNKEKILHLFLTVIKQCTVLMDFSSEKLKSSTAAFYFALYISMLSFSFPSFFCTWILDSYKTVPRETDQNHNITLPEIKYSLLATKQ